MSRFLYRFLACILPVAFVAAIAGAATTTAGKTAFVPTGSGLFRVTSGVEGAAGTQVNLASDVTGTLPASAAAGFDGVTVTGTPSSGQVPVASSGTAAAWGPVTATTLQGTAVSATAPTNQQILMDQGGTWTPVSISGGDILQSTTPYGLWSVLNLGNGSIRVGTWGSTLYGLEWGASLSNPPGIHQADTTTASATGKTFTIQAQNATGATSTGGELDLLSGTGTTANGLINFKPGGVSQANLGGVYGLVVNGAASGAASVGGRVLSSQYSAGIITMLSASAGGNMFIGLDAAGNQPPAPNQIYIQAYDSGSIPAVIVGSRSQVHFQSADTGVQMSVPIVGDGTHAYTVHGYTTVNVAGNTSVTLTAAVSGGYGSHYIDLTGALTGTIYVYFPQVAGAEWCVGNTTTGAYTIKLASSATNTVYVTMATPGVPAVSGSKCIRIFSDGTYIRAAE